VHGEAGSQQNNAIQQLQCIANSIALFVAFEIVHALVQLFVCFERKIHIQAFGRIAQPRNTWRIGGKPLIVIDLT